MTLARYEGPGTPDLEIVRGSAGVDRRTGERARGVVITRERELSYEGNYEKIHGANDLLPATGKYLTKASLAKATLILDNSLTPGTTGEANVAVHEVGHLESAAVDFMRYLQLGADDMELGSDGKPLPHDDRPLERAAEGYRDAACGVAKSCVSQPK